MRIALLARKAKRELRNRGRGSEASDIRRQLISSSGDLKVREIVKLAIFVVFGSLGGQVRLVDGVPYLRFIVPGLVFLGVANNAFLNSSSSLFITKLQGTIVDLLAAPMGPVEILFGFITGAMIRGLMVGVLICWSAIVIVSVPSAKVML